MAFRVRRALIGDEAVLRALRLEALTDSPAAFGSTYERELARTAADWQRWLTPGAVFIADVSGAARGLVAAALDQNDATTAHLMAMWVHPSLRGLGAADRLIASVLMWAAEAGAREVKLLVTRANDRAQRCYARNGFRPTGREVVREKDGLIDVEMGRLVSR
jgi:GNAT superfamily N-acetyltransferase